MSDERALGGTELAPATILDKPYQVPADLMPSSDAMSIEAADAQVDLPTPKVIG